jgi:hypothetical protein
VDSGVTPKVSAQLIYRDIAYLSDWVSQRFDEFRLNDGQVFTPTRSGDETLFVQRANDQKARALLDELSALFRQRSIDINQEQVRDWFPVRFEERASDLHAELSLDNAGGTAAKDSILRRNPSDHDEVDISHHVENPSFFATADAKGKTRHPVGISILPQNFTKLTACGFSTNSNFACVQTNEFDGQNRAQ